MTLTVVDVAIIVGCAALVAAFVSGLFVGARLVRSAGRDNGNGPTKAEVGELVLQLLREAVNVVRELRMGQAGEVDRPELPSAGKRPRRQRRSATNSQVKEG